MDVGLIDLQRAIDFAHEDEACPETNGASKEKEKERDDKHVGEEKESGDEINYFKACKKIQYGVKEYIDGGRA